MLKGRHIHWHITPDCNLDCTGCLRDNNIVRGSSSDINNLAEILADSKVEQVTLGGAEATLVRGLPQIARTLKEGGLRVRLHTNGILLSNGYLSQMLPYVDNIALPIDSTNKMVQEDMRGAKFIPTHKRVLELGRIILESGKDLDYHTVFTALNASQLSGVYRAINNEGFTQWSVYEFNYELARQRLISIHQKGDIINPQAVMREFKKLKVLKGKGSPSKGYTDCLLANFLLAEERFSKLQDTRVKFTAVREPRKTYAFLYNSGDIFYYSWFSGSKRKLLGNLHNECIPDLFTKLDHIEREQQSLDEESESEWVEAVTDTPPWVRYEDGACSDEEISVIRHKYSSKFLKLCTLYKERTQRIWDRELPQIS